MKKFELPGYRKLAKRCIKIVSTCLDELDVKWALGHGTLMGQVKINGLLETCSDIDIDTFNVSEETIFKIKDKLKPYLPFETLRKYRNKYYLLAFRVNRMRVDIHFWYNKNDYMYRVDSHKPAPNEHVFYKLPSHIFDELIPIDFVGTKAYIPSDSHLYLDVMYGDHWKLKDSGEGWHTKRDSPCLIQESECTIYE